METIIIQTDSIKAKALKQFLKAFNIAFKVSKKDESSYNSEFVEKVFKQSENAKQGNTIEIDPKNVWGSLQL